MNTFRTLNIPRCIKVTHDDLHGSMAGLGGSVQTATVASTAYVREASHYFKKNLEVVIARRHVGG